MYNKAGAVAKAGTDFANGENHKHASINTPTVTAVKPVRPPAATPEALSI